MMNLCKIFWCSCLCSLLLMFYIECVTDPYENLIIEVKADLEDCSDILGHLQPLLDATSGKLYDATHGRLSFSKATVVVPIELVDKCDADLSSSTNFTNLPPVHLTVGQDHPVFGRNPWTQQTQGCGKPGDLLYLPYTFLNGDSYDDKASLLMNEWAKFRWGVFEEYGLQDDPVYPLSYPDNYTHQEGILWKPNYCVDKMLKGHFRTDCEHPDCPFVLDSSQSATSSMLSLPTVKSITKFCDQDSHQPSVPTKQNALCKEKSVWEIFAAHPDGQHKSSRVGRSVDIKYAVLNNSTSRQYILLIDQTDFLGLIPGRWEMLTASLEQWILEDVLEGAEVGLVTFDLYVNLLKSMTVIDPSSRQSIVDAIPSDAGTSSLKQIVRALSFITNEMTNNYATIILIVDPNNIDSTDSEEAMREASGSNAVWPILYPVHNDIDPEHISRFQGLAATTGGQMLITKNLLFNSTDVSEGQSIRVQRTLVEYLRYVQEGTLAQMSCNTHIQIMEQPVESITSTFGILVGDNVDLNQPIILYVYSHSPPSKLSISSPTHQELSVQNVTNTSFKAEINNIKRGLSNITIEFPTYFEAHWVELLGMKVGEVISARFWASQDLSFVKLDQPTDPVVFFTKLSSGSLPIVGADVTVLIRSEEKSHILVLRDKGGGPDITGQDGSYTAYWTLAPSGIDAYSIMLQVRTSDLTKVIGEESNSEGILCCGSNLNLNAVNSKTMSISFDQKVGYSYVSSDAGQTDVFPPARVIDLRGFVDSDGVNLAFTAPGDDLNHGYALEYTVWWFDAIIDEWRAVTATQYRIVEGGSIASVTFDAPVCDQLIRYRITAKDTRLQEGEPSNSVSVILPCDWKPTLKPVQEKCTTNGLVIAGTFIGGFALAIFMVVIGLLLYNKRQKTLLKEEPGSQREAQNSENTRPNKERFTNKGFVNVRKPQSLYFLKRSDSEIIRRENKNRKLPLPPVQEQERVMVYPASVTAALQLGNVANSQMSNESSCPTPATTPKQKNVDSISFLKVNSTVVNDTRIINNDVIYDFPGDIYGVAEVNDTRNNDTMYADVVEIDSGNSNLFTDEQNEYNTVVIQTVDEVTYI